MRRLLVVLGLVVAAAILAARFDSDDPDGPPEIEYGRDVCTDCNMIISEPRFAAAYRDSEGNPAIFDDIGDLLRYGHEKGDLDEATAWVHDYDDEEWIEAQGAWFVKSDIQTPMASGLAAFAEEAGAKAFADEHDGDVLRWRDLIENAADMGGKPMAGHGESNGE